jgi:hypothetical protein
MNERNLGFEAQIVINDLDSMNVRIEQLQAHPKYTEAQTAVQRAKQAMIDGASDLHQRAMRERFAKIDDCPGHVASETNPKVCARCGVHVEGA